MINGEDADLCTRPRCHARVGVVYLGTPLCHPHYEELCDQMDREYEKRAAADLLKARKERKRVVGILAARAARRDGLR